VILDSRKGPLVDNPSIGVLGLLMVLVGCSDPPATGGSASAASTLHAPSALSSPSASTAPTATATPDEIAAQHLLITYKGAKNAKGSSRSKDDAKKLAQELHDKAAKGADFGELATKHSEDPASKERLGSLGKFKRSEMVKAFSEVAFALPVGGLSEPIETEFGFHVIKRNQ